MESIEFKVTANFLKTDVLAFAIANGYQENEEQTPEKYVSDYFHAQLVNLVGNESVNKMVQIKETEKLAEIKTIQERISGSIIIETL